MRVAVIGTGYVGLVAGTCFAETGNDVICVDTDKAKVERLNSGEIPIFEPGLEELVVRSRKKGNLKFTHSTKEAVLASEVIFLAVGTPSGEDGSADLKYLKAAAEEVARAMDGYRIIVNKSTVPVGSHVKVSDWMKPHTKHNYDVISNPEFLKEGSAVSDFMKPDRVVIGTYVESAFNTMAKLYSPFLRQGNPIIWMDPISAEITKYACNAFLATKISFMNEMSVLCDQVGGDIEKIRTGMASDVRIGKHFLYAGLGYGGSCFPKDVRAIIHTGNKNDAKLGIVEAAEEANDRQKKVIGSKIRKYFSENLAGKTFAVWGLSFKPNTDDIREAPSLILISELLQAGARVNAYDPISIDNTSECLPASDTLKYCQSADEAVFAADALVIVTEWTEFRNVDLMKIKDKMRGSVIFDGRNIFDAKDAVSAGFDYCSIGRKNILVSKVNKSKKAA